MDLLSHIWQIYLYQPLVNLLVYLYSTVAGQNLGWAVVALTVSLRVVLLPLSIVEGRNEIVIEKMQEDVAIAEKHFRADPMYMKEHIRLLMRKNKIRPWAKTLSLAIQLLVLVLLYQVFITGISGAQLSKILYSFVEYPGRLNTLFFSYQYGSTPKDFIAFDVGQRSLFWAALVGVVLVVDIIFKMKKLNQKATGGDLTYLIMFPLASFAILWYLPMVKSLFIFTSMM
ncbi:MAG: YidC/Oxa1 family membrane protein insertase, partial [Candidatus Magasanikbacteria bacterium]|nr:YidC/Oxa1 family membrane protein insertase [Candidatus Magasanikbacteria bacterium]